MKQIHTNNTCKSYQITKLSNRNNFQDYENSDILIDVKFYSFIRPKQHRIRKRKKYIHAFKLLKFYFSININTSHKKSLFTHEYYKPPSPCNYKYLRVRIENILAWYTYPPLTGARSRKSEERRRGKSQTRLEMMTPPFFSIFMTTLNEWMILWK